jgi:hypothetical protein
MTYGSRSLLHCYAKGEEQGSCCSLHDDGKLIDD